MLIKNSVMKIRIPKKGALRVLVQILSNLLKKNLEEKNLILIYREAPQNAYEIELFELPGQRYILLRGHGS